MPAYDPLSCHSGCVPPARLNWEEINHFLLLVGYGEEIVNGTAVKCAPRPALVPMCAVPPDAPPPTGPCCEYSSSNFPPPRSLHTTLSSHICFTSPSPVPPSKRPRRCPARCPTPPSRAPHIPTSAPSRLYLRSPTTRRYWTVANPAWGQAWGEGGFARIVRGRRELATATLAVAVDPMV